MPKIVNSLLICLLASVLWSTPIQAKPFTPSEVYTAHWPPYVNKLGQELGTASRIVQLIYYQMEIEPDWQELDYYFSYQQIMKGGIKASFPYFRTQKRANEVLFSAPLMKVENGVFYSTRGEVDPERVDINRLRIGRVAGYSYGENLTFMLDKARVFNSEIQALTGLVKGEIDLLPMSVEVARKLIQEYFPHRIHEFKLLDEYRSRDAVHLIAPKTLEGESFIADFNTALETLKRQGMIDQILNSPKTGGGSGYVRLIPAEGFPVITGYELSPEGDKLFYVVPQGSRAVVLSWDDVVLKPHKTEKIFDGMMHYSIVHIVDGPHAGLELHVRNMHLKVN
ncbi:MAG: transporter substrate-binding domain-containing protein [Motiliproteus sp.]